MQRDQCILLETKAVLKHKKLISRDDLEAQYIGTDKNPWLTSVRLRETWYKEQLLFQVKLLTTVVCRAERAVGCDFQSDEGVSVLIAISLGFSDCHHCHRWTRFVREQ